MIEKAADTDIICIYLKILSQKHLCCKGEDKKVQVTERPKDVMRPRREAIPVRLRI